MNDSNMFSRIVVTLLALHTVRSQIPSPCPDVLIYEPKNSELDRWYAVVTLSSSQQLRGIWLRITLDRPAELLGNVFGDATTEDNREFLIRSQNYILGSGKKIPVRFFVKFNAASIIPSVTEVNLNGRLICPSSNPQDTARPITARPSSKRGTTYFSNSTTRKVTQRPIAINGTTLSNIPVVNTNLSNNRPQNTRPTGSINNIRPTRPSNTFSTDSYVRPTNNRPSTSSYNDRPNTSSKNNYNNRPSSSFSNSDEDFDTNYRPSSSSNYFNSGSDSYDNGYDNGSNRPVDTGISLENNRDHDTTFNENNYNNQGTAFGLPMSSENNEDFFSGDFSAIINRPPSNSVRQNVNRNKQCGRIATHASPLISYGQNTIPGQWPWHAALYHSKGIQLMYTCGGTLISSIHILTAAHCVTRPRTNRAINPQNLVVYLGKYNLKKFGSEIQDKEVVDIYVHPEYNHSVYHNDISILRLGEPVQITNYVRPVCLWEDVADLNEIEGHYGTVVGWGFDHNGELSTSLMQAQMPIVSTIKCIYSNRDFFSQFTSEKSFCAGFKNRTSVCNGDSGGGMVFPKSGTSGSNTVWQIRGIVSVGVALQGQAICDPTQYIVFTDVAKHLEWVEQILTKYP